MPLLYISVIQFTKTIPLHRLLLPLVQILIAAINTPTPPLVCDIDLLDVKETQNYGLILTFITGYKLIILNIIISPETRK